MPRRGGATSEPDAPYEFVMMTFVNMNNPGLLVLPTHRVVHSLASFSADDFQKLRAARSSKSKRSIPRSTPPAPPRFCASAAAPEPHCWPSPPTALSCCTHPKRRIATFLPGLSARQQSLDVVQLHKCLLEGVLKLSEESIRNQQNLSYMREASEALARFVEKEPAGKAGKHANIAFLMNPCPVQQVRDVAFAGEVMPQKSTDFYPKLLSGLTAYALD